MSTDELLQLRAEEEVAREMGLRWQERGPRPDMLPEGQTTWMGAAVSAELRKMGEQGWLE